MPAKSAGKLVINLSAGTAEFLSAMDRSNAKLREFGRTAKESGDHAVSGVQATSGALRVLEGGLNNNLRAAERFTANVLRLGPILQGAFPLIGGLAFAGLLLKLADEVKKFYTTTRDASEKTANAFRELGAPLRLVNDNLAITNQQVANQIAKLEGRRENTLALALLEAKKAADELANSLDKDLKAAMDVFEKQKPDLLQRLLGAPGGLTGAPADEYWGGKSGVGGLIAHMQNLRETTSPEDFPAAQDKALEEAIAHYEKTVIPDLEKQAKNPSIAPFSGTDVQASLEQAHYKVGILYEELERNLQERIGSVQTGTVKTLEAGRTAAGEDRPFEKSISDQAAKVDQLKKELDAIGKGDRAEQWAKAWGEAGIEIAKVNEELHRINPNLKLTAAQEADEKAEAIARVSLEAEKAWQTKYHAGTLSIADRIKSLDLVTAAIGKGYEAAKKASVESSLIAEFGEHYGDAEWLGRDGHQAEMDARRGQLGTEYNSQHTGQSERAINGLNQQIALERELAAVQAQGAEAVRTATLAMKLRQMVAEGSTNAQIKAEIQLSQAQRANISAKAVTDLDEKTAATQRLTAATLQSAAAIRQATLDNQIAEARRAGASPEQIEAIKRNAATERGLELATLAVQTDKVRAIDQEIDDLKEARALYGDSLGLEVRFRDLENQRLQTLAEETAALGRLRDGVRAFFIEMQEQARTAGQIIFDALNSALDKSTENLAKMLTGQRPKGGWGPAWGKEFQSIGTQMVQSSLKSLAQYGFGALGAHFGITGLTGKPTGSAANPYYVIVQNGVSSVPGFPGGIPPIGGSFPGNGGLLGTGQTPTYSPDNNSPYNLERLPSGLILRTLNNAGGGPSPLGDDGSDAVPFLRRLATGPGLADTAGGGFGDMTSLLSKDAVAGTGGLGVMSSLLGSLAGLASGGYMSAGESYLVGENGPEILSGLSGRITNNSDTRRILNTNRGGDVFYTVDARGSDLGAENRIRRGIELSHNSAVANAVRANVERSKRVPRGSSH
jgi:hypothetical protein